MSKATPPQHLHRVRAAVLAIGLLAGGASVEARAQGAAALAAVAPVRDCEGLSGLDLRRVADTPAAVRSAVVIDTPKGRFCKIVGEVEPAIGFEVDLPLAGWTQRFLQTGCGGLCGRAAVRIDQAGTCAPALDGAFAVAASDLGHRSGPGENPGAFARDPQKRIDFAYRANHATAQVAKALIAAFYGQGPRFSYFSGCSDGGREALMEAQRYPDDFDGISAGAPVMAFQVQNSFYHAWLVRANRGPDGSAVLLASKLPVLHAAVLARCDHLDGLDDGLLSDPRACPVDPGWAACAPGVTDTSGCLTADEAAVVRRAYEGPTDGAGRRFTVGGPLPGSELQWDFVPETANGASMSARMAASTMEYMILPEVSPADADISRFAFDAANFTRVTELHPLNDATNTNLAPFAARGGKLLMWHGWSDSSVSPMISVAYYKVVRKQLGASATDRFLRLFLLPGTGHCGGGDGFSQLDTLSALMRWIEGGHAPTELAVDRVPDRARGPRGPLAGGMPPALPYARPPQAPIATRTIYPFPQVPRAHGDGYAPGASPVKPEPDTVEWYGASLIGPDFQKAYRVDAGKLVAMEHR